MDVVLAARLLLVINRLLIALLTMEEQAAQRRIAALQSHLGPGRGHGVRAPKRRFPANNVYLNCARQGDHAFQTYSRFSHAQFDELLEELRPLIEANRHVRMNVPEPSDDRRSCKLTTENRLLLTMKFLVAGTSNEQLGVEFGVHPHVVSEDIQHVVFAIIDAIGYELHFPAPGPETDARRGTVSARYPDAIGIIDMTYTPAPRQVGDFSGHRWRPIRAHQVVADPMGFFLHVTAGLAGARHDSYSYRLSEVPALLEASNVRLLGDPGYVGMPRIVTPPTAADEPDDAKREALSELHTSRRSRIEQFFSVLKQWFAVAGREWQRHDRSFLACCFVACCLLHNRRKRLNI